MIVVDASVLVDTLIGDGRGVDRIADEELAAPHLLDTEVASALRRLTLAGELSERSARRALTELTELEISRYAHIGLLARAWELRANVTAYDAMYVTLAEALEVPLVTLDHGLAGVPGTQAVVEVIPVDD